MRRAGEHILIVCKPGCPLLHRGRTLVRQAKKGRRRDHSTTFRQVFGAIYLLIGILGFVPPLLAGNLQGTGTISGPFTGLLLGLFPVNWLHNIAHAVIGVMGLAVHRSPAEARTYALVLRVA